MNQVGYGSLLFLLRSMETIFVGKGKQPTDFSNYLPKKGLKLLDFWCELTCIFLCTVDKCPAYLLCLFFLFSF